jgi:hypothetical protein
MVALFGIFTFVLGVAAWVMPDSRFVRSLIVDIYPPRARATAIERFIGNTREQKEASGMLFGRFLMPLGGVLLFVSGAFSAAGAFRCSITGVFAALWGPPLLVASAVGLVVGLFSFRLSTVRLLTNAVGTACFMFAGYEAAAFHEGVQAERWSVSTMVLFFLLAVVTTVMQIRAKPQS